jgi:hypothetical protein
VVSLHELEGLLDITECPVAGALPALGDEVDFVAAVSMKLTPRSSALSMRGTAISKLLGFSRALWPPREKRPTLKPVFPKLRVGMEACVF